MKHEKEYASKLKCLFIYDNKYKRFDNNVYTAGKVTNEVFKFFAKPEEQITAITRMEYPEDVNTLSLSRITLENVKFLPVKGLSFSKVFTLNLPYNLRLSIQEIRKSDYIVARLPSFLGIFILCLNTNCKKPYFIEVVGDAEDALLMSRDKPNLGFKLFVKSFSRLNKYFIKNADGVIYVTKNSLQKKYPTKGYTKYASDVEIKIQPKSLRESDYLNTKPYFKIGLIGDYNNHYKGIREAIQAVKLLSKEGAQISLHILGSGSLKEHYMDLAKELGVQDRVLFEGRLNGYTEVMQWLNSLDIYIQPSYTEGLPRALIEAMSVGLPAVGSNVGGIPELLSTDDLVEPRDPQSLAKKVQLLIESSQLRFTRGKRNYFKAKEYDTETLTKRRFDFWNYCRNIAYNQSSQL